MPATRACSSSGSPGADDRHRSARRQLAVELDGGGIHGHGTDHSAHFSRDPHLGAGQVAAEPVGVADRHDPDPGVALGDEEPARSRSTRRPAGASTARSRSSTRAPARGRPRPDPSRTARARRARCRSERRRTATPGAGARRRCSRRAASDEPAASVAARKRSICTRAKSGSVSAVARCVITPATARVGRRQLRDAPAAHAGVELHVHDDAFGDLLARDDELQPGLARLGDFARRRRPEDEHPRRREGVGAARAPRRRWRRTAPARPPRAQHLRSRAHRARRRRPSRPPRPRLRRPRAAALRTLRRSAPRSIVISDLT